MDFKGAFFHGSEQLKICVSSATTDIDIDNNLKGLSDADKYLKKRRRAEIVNLMKMRFWKCILNQLISTVSGKA